MIELDLEPIRQAVSERVARDGLRQVARQIGMSPSGLSKFLGGALPYQKTRRKMAAWSNRLGVGDKRSPEDVLIDELLNPLPEAGQKEVRAEIKRVLNRARRRWLAKGRTDRRTHNQRWIFKGREPRLPPFVYDPLHPQPELS